MLAFPWLLYFIAVIFYSYQYFLRISISGMEPTLTGRLHVSALNIGFIASAFLYTQIIMTLPSGLLIDHYGVRKMLTLASFIVGIGCFIFAISHHVAYLEAGRACMGFGAAFAFAGTAALIRYWFSEKQFTFLVSLTFTLGTLAAAISGGPLADYATKSGWEGLMFGGSILCFMLAFLFYRLVIHKHTPLPKARRIKVKIILRQILRKKELWLVGIAYGFILTTTTAFIAVWVVPFVKAAYGAEYVNAGEYAVSLFFIGSAVGAPIVASISNYFNSRKTCIMIFTVLLLLITLIIIYALLPIWLLMTLFVFQGIFYSCNIVYMTIVRNNVGVGVIATAISVVNILGYLIGSILAPIMGEILGLEAHNFDLSNLFNLPVHNFRSTLLFIPACLLISIVFLFFIKDKHVRGASEEQIEAFREES